MTGKALTVILLLVGLLLAALLRRSSDLAWMALPFLFYLGMGVLRSPSPAAIRLHAVRRVSQAQSGDVPTVEVQVTVRNQGIAIDHLYLADPLPGDTTIVDGCTGLRLALANGEETALTYSFREKRGRYAWETLRAVASDPLGLVEVACALPAPAEVQVQPERGRLQRLPLRPQGTLHSPGSIPARLGGRGTDFWGVREYHPGDSLRWLNWRLTARHPRQLFTKEFEQEEIADIGLILDARLRTEVRAGDDSLFEHAVRAAAALAESFLHDGHRVGLLVYDGHPTPVFPGYGKVQLNRILNCLAQVKPGSDDRNGSFEYLPLRMFANHALLVVLSPLSTGDWPFFPRLRACGFQGLLVSPDPFDFAFSMDACDEATGLAIRTARLERRLELRQIAQLAIPVIDWPVRRPLFPLVRRALNHTRRPRER